jgi:putative ATPase
MACAPKSNASASAIWEATDDVKNNRTLPVPKHLRDSHYPGAADREHGAGYQYSHDYEGGVSPGQDYLGVKKVYYDPTDRGYEKHIRAYLNWVQKLRNQPAPSREER